MPAGYEASCTIRHPPRPFGHYNRATSFSAAQAYAAITETYRSTCLWIRRPVVRVHPAVPSKYLKMKTILFNLFDFFSCLVFMEPPRNHAGDFHTTACVDANYGAHCFETRADRLGSRERSSPLLPRYLPSAR